MSQHRLSIARALKPLVHDSVPPKIGSNDIVWGVGEDWVAMLYYSISAVQAAVRDLTELPPAAFDDLIQASAKANFYQLEAIITTLGKLGASVGQPAVDQLARYLKWRDPMILRATITALTEIGDPAALPSIKQHCDSDEELVRNKALAAVALLSPDFNERLGHLEQTLANDDTSALDTLLSQPDDEIPWDDLYMLLESPHDLVRRNLILQIARRRKLPKAVAVKHIADPVLIVRRTAAEHLARFKKDDGLLELMFQLLQDPEKAVARAAQKWLRPRLNDHRQRLIDLLRSGTSMTRFMVLQMLTKGPSEDLIEIVGPLLTTRSSVDMRRAVLSLLRKFPDHRSARNWVIRALADQTRDVREAALRTAVPGANEGDLEGLRDNFEKHNQHLTETIALVGQIGGAEAERLLIGQLPAGNKAINIALCQALDARGAFEARAAIAAAVKQTPYDLLEPIDARLAELELIYEQLSASLNPVEARDLLRISCAPDAEARLTAVRQIEQRQLVGAARPLLERVIFDHDEKVRGAAIAQIKPLADAVLSTLLKEKLQAYPEHEVRGALETIAAIQDTTLADDVAQLLDRRSMFQDDVAKTLEALGSDQAARAQHQQRRATVIETLTTYSLSDEEKFAAWQDDMDIVSELVSDFSSQENLRLTQVLLVNGWQPSTPAEQAAALFGEAEPALERLPEAALPALQPWFDQRNDSLTFKFAKMLVGQWPKQCKPYVAAGLTADDPQIRTRNLTLALEQQGLFAPDEIAGWLDSDEPFLQSAAARLLASTGDVGQVTRQIDLLAKAIDEQDRERVGALASALGRAGTPEALDAVAPLLPANGETQGRYAYPAIDGLGQCSNTKATQLLVFALRAAPVRVRRYAAKGLIDRDWQPESATDQARLDLYVGKLDTLTKLDESALPIVVEYALDSERVGFPVFEYLARFGGTEAIGAMARADWTYFDKDQRAAVKAAHKQHYNEALPVLIEILDGLLEHELERDFVHPKTTAQLGDVVSWMGLGRPTAAIEALMRLLAKTSLHTGYRRGAAEILGKLKHAPAVSAICELLQSVDDNAMKRAMAEALLRIGDTAALEVLQAERGKTDYAPLQKMLDKAIAKLT